MVQVLEYLISKYEVLNSSPSSTKKIKIKKLNK
jgi:hypothetical protein